MSKHNLTYRRILLKYSGEVLCGTAPFGIDPKALNSVVDSVAHLRSLGVEIAIVLGGGNFFRGKNLLSSGFDQAKADQMGMCATVMNAIALEESLRKNNVAASIFSALPITSMVKNYNILQARDAISNGEVVICAGGTGSPFFTTDSAAALRAIELNANIVIKATKVDGIYSDDPIKNPQAKRYDYLSFDEVIQNKLAVMDNTAICLCQANNMPIRVFNMNDAAALERIVLGEHIGTFVGEKNVSRD